MKTAERLVALLDHLGLAAAHFATQIPGDIAGLVAAGADRIGGLVLCAPTRLDPASFAPVAGRLLMISGETGLTADTTLRARERLPGAERYVLAGYEAAGWSDVVADRTGAVADAMSGFLARFVLPAKALAEHLKELKLKPQQLGMLLVDEPSQDAQDAIIPRSAVTPASDAP